jgi:acyl carrier protein
MTNERTHIENELIELLAGLLNMDRQQFRRDATLADLGVNSLSTVEAVFAIEEKYNISIPFNANEQRAGGVGAFHSVGQLLDLVVSLVSPQEVETAVAGGQ